MPFEVRIEQTPTRYPGTCSSCGAASSSPRKWWIDTGCDEKGDLTVFAIIFCDTCFDVLASAAGYVKRGDEVEYYLKRTAELEEQVDNLESIRIALNTLGIDVDSLINLSRVGVVGSRSEHKANSEDGSQEDSGTKSMGARKKRFIKSPDDKDVGELQSGESDSPGILSI